MRAIDALDEAIKHYDEIAEECRKKADIERNDYMDMRDNTYEARQLAQWLNELKYLREKIEQPTIEPQRKKGKWILVKGSNGKDYHKCSECLHTQEITGVKNYCAVCGAEIEAEEEWRKKHDSNQ